MKMNVWGQIRLFLGDLSLAPYERETGWVDTQGEDGGGKQTQNKKDGGEEMQLLFS